MPDQFGGPQCHAATEALSPPFARPALAPARGGRRLEAGHALGRVVPIPLLQLLLQIPDAGFQTGNQRLLLGNDHLQLIDQLALADHEIHQRGVRERHHHLPLQHHPVRLSGRLPAPVVLPRP